MHTRIRSNKARRQLSSGLVCLALTLSAWTVGTATAQADPTLIDCAGSVSSTFTPGLHLLPSTVTLASGGPLGTCVGGDADHVSGSYSALGTGSLSCSVNLPFPASGVVTWRNSSGHVTDVSNFTALALPLRPLGENVVAVTGTITTGDLTGRGVVLEFVLPTTALTACLTPAGLTDISGPANITVLPV
ncbi:hypothetical protein [Kitasatospora sp. NPDC004272]